MAGFGMAGFGMGWNGDGMDGSGLVEIGPLLCMIWSGDEGNRCVPEWWIK